MIMNQRHAGISLFHSNIHIYQVDRRGGWATHEFKGAKPRIKPDTLCFPPIRVTRANLIETKTTSLNTLEERCRLNDSHFWQCHFFFSRQSLSRK